MTGSYKIRQRNGKYGYDLHHNGKRYRQSGFDKKSDATAAANERIRQLDTGHNLNNKLLFQDYYVQWIKDHKQGQIRDKSYQWYENALNIFNDYFGEATRVADIDRSKYQAFINHYAGTHSRESTRKLNNCLKGAFKDLAYDGYIAKDPTYNIKVSGSVPAQEPEDKYLEESEFRQLIDHVKGKDDLSYLFIYILAITGARFGEVQSLRYDQLKEDAIYIVGTKTENSSAAISVTADQMAHIHEVLAKHPRHDNGTLFNGISHQAVQKVLKRAVSKLGIKGITLHGIRHTHASVLLSQGISIYYISKRLRHKSINTTLRVYSHLLKDAYDVEDEKTLEILRGF